MQTLAKVQRELRREEAVECVGPPRPTRTGRIPFREQDVLRLEVEQVMRSSPSLERVDVSSRYRWEPGKKAVGVQVKTDGDHGFLHLHFQVDGEPVAQTFALAGTAMRMGGMRWAVKCPETGKMVRDLYLLFAATIRIFVRAMPWACPIVRAILDQRTLFGACREAYGPAWRASLA